MKHFWSIVTRGRRAIRLKAAAWADKDWSGGLKASEQIRLDRWLETSDAHTLEFSETQALLGSRELDLALAAADRQRTKIASLHARKRRQTALPLFAWLSGLGAVAATAGGIAFLVVGPVMQQTQPAQVLAEAPSFLQTPNGQGASARLPDGTDVQLNGGTRLVVQFSPGQRRVQLVSGDAYFQVAHDTDRPFIVETPDVEARALGTAFSVSRFATSTVVSVMESRVRVDSRGPAQHQVTAEPGTRVTVGRDGALAVATFNAAAAGDWRAGWMETSSISLADLAGMIERRTGRRIAMQDSIAALNVSGRFEIDDPVSALRWTALVHNLELATDGDTLTLDRKLRAPAER